jgi:hypothetical protein
MVRPATLDRVENGGSGSDINPREQKPKETTLDNRALFRPVIIQSAAVLEAVQGAASKRRSMLPKSEQRPAVTASARAPALETCGRGRRKPAARSNKRKVQAKKQVSKKESACVRGGD